MVISSNRKITRPSNLELVSNQTVEVPDPKIENMKDRERPILNIITAYLKNIKFPSKQPFKDKTRKNVILEEGVKNVEDIVIDAFAIGKVRAYDKKDLVDSVNSRKFPELLLLLDKFVKIHNPKFSYTTIQINRSVQTAYHRDKGNIGLSYCFAFGDFTGGGVEVKFADNVEKVYDNHNKWLYYDGHSLEHRSAPVKKGTRFAIIFFTHN